ncbi:MAG: HAD-IC family P-type ATPase, partial [Chromatiales bacterium]|nr:HAD-IC family P-type ATPase [Chromatiales bacterium]
MTVTAIVMPEEQWVLDQEARASDALKALLTKLVAVERLSEHPLATAVVTTAEALGADQDKLSVEQFAANPGFGVSAQVAGEPVLIGTPAWLEKNGVALNPALEKQAVQLDQQGIGSFRCAVNGVEAALIAVEDRIRPDAPALIKALKEEGMELTLLSGDRKHTAQAIADRLGGMNVIAEVLPEDKDRVIGELQKNNQRVAMVGDGINDAPALVRADVGIALGSGTDVSIASADIVLMSSELKKVRQAAQLSRRTLRTIRQNIGISITYNVIMVPLAMAAFVTPLVAAVSMPISSLLVIGNAARIRLMFRQ